MAAVAGEAEAEAELRSGAPGAWAEQAPRSSQCQGEPLVAAPQPMLGTLSLDGQHNGHTWTPTQAWTLAAPSGTSTQECCLHTSPKSPKQDGPTHSTPESSTQEASLHAPTDTLVNQEPLYKHQGLPLTQEGSAAMKALPISPTRNSPLHSISPQEEPINVLPATVDREVPTYQVMSPHTCMRTAPGQRHEADTTGQQGSPDSFPLTTTDERTLCKCSAQQQTFHLHHDTSPAKLEGNVTVCHQALEGLLCEATVHQDPMIDCLGTRMQIDQSAGVLTSVVSHSDFADTSLLESEKNFAMPPEPPAKEGSIQEITQAPLQAVENLHSVPPMALSQEESSNATLGTLALDRLTTPKGPLAHTFLDHTGLLTKAQILEDSSLFVVPSLVDSRSASDPSPLLDTFNRVPSLVDSLIEHMPLEGRATLTSLDCTLLPSLDSPESSPALCSSNVGVVSSLHSTMTLPVHGSETGSVTSISDPMAYSCLNNLDELPPVDCVVTTSNDGACGKNVMLVDSRMPDSSPALNESEKECFFSVVSSVHPSNPLAKISSPVTSLTKVPFCPLNLPNADIPAVVCSEANTSSFLVEANSEGTIPVDADTKGPFPRDLKNPFVEHVDGKGPTPVDPESAGHFPGFAGGSFPVQIQTQPLFPLDSHDDGAHLLDVNNPNPSHNISLLDIHSEVESAISVDGEVEGQCAVNVQVEAPFHVNMVTHSSTLTSSRASDALMSNMCSPLEAPLGKALSNVAVIEASDPVASVEATAVFSSIDSTSGDDEVPVGKTLSDVAVNEASDPVASVEAKSVFASIRSTYGDDATVDWAEGTSGAPKLQGPLFVVKVERSSEVVRPELSTAACLAKEPLVIVQALSTLAGECFPSRLSFEVSPSLVPLPVGIPQVFSEFPLKIVPSQESSENDQVSLEAAPCQKPSEVAIIPSHFTSSQGSLIHSLVSSEAAPSRAPLEVALPPLESSSSSASEFTSVPSSSNIFEGELYSEDAPHQTQFLLEAPLPSPKSYFPQAPLAMEQTLVPLPITFSLEEVLLPRDTPMLCTNALVVQPSPSESPIHDDISLPTILELPVSAKVPSTMGGLGLQLSQDGLLVKTTLQNDQLLPDQLLPQDGVTKHEEPLVKPPFHQVEPLLSRNIALPAVPFLQDGLLTGLNPGSEVRVTLDHIIEDALVVSFRLGERIFSGVLMDVSKRFGPHGIPVTVFPKRECKNTPSSIQPQVTSFHEEIMADCEPKVFSETFSSVVQNSEPSRIQSVWTSNPPPLFHEGAPYPPPLFIRDTYNQSIPQPPPRKIRRPKRKLYREEPTSIMNAIKLRPRQVLCDKCKTSVLTDKKEIKRGLSASEDSRKRRHENLATVSKKLKTNHNVDGKGQTESQKRNVVAKVSNLAHGRSREVRIPTQSNSPKSQLHTKKVLQSKNIEQAKAREVLKLAKEKAQKKHMDTPGSKNTHPRGQVTRRFQNPSSGTLPPRLRLKPQRYRNEENDSSLKTRLEAVQSSKMIIKPQPRHITTRSAGEALTEMESSTKDPDEANQAVQDLEVCALPGEQEDPQSLDKSPSKSNITVYVTLNQDQPGSSSASVCSSEGTDDLKSSHSECSSTENFDFPPGSMHTPPSSSSSSSLKEEKKANNELKIKVFSKNVSKCIGADGRTICAGDIVWAKIYGFPWWPARILNITVSRKDNGLLVRQEARISWFGSPTTSFVAVSQLAPFLDNFQLRFNKKRKGLYRKAITEAAKAAKQLTPEVRALLTQFET